MIPEGDHSDPLNPCRNDEIGVLIGDTLEVLSPDDDVGERGFKSMENAADGRRDVMLPCFASECPYLDPRR
jgi:hypothetical protein